MLAHLAPVLGQDVAEAEDVAVRALVEHERSDRHERVEPAPRLIDGLGDEVGRVGRPRLLGIAVRGTELGERHRSGVEPGVDHLRDAPVDPVLAGAGEGHLVDERPVRVEVGERQAGQLAELGERADADQLGRVGVVAPHRQRRAPVPIARERPVDVVLEPVAVAAVLDRGREPVRRLVLGEQAVLDRGRADVPGRQRVVHQRGVAAPAVRVGVRIADVAVEQAPGRQVSDQRLVRVLEEQPRDRAGLGAEVPVGGDRVDDRQAVAASHSQVVGAEGRRLVHQTGAVGRGHVVGEHDVVGVLDRRASRTGAGRSSARVRDRRSGRAPSRRHRAQRPTAARRPRTCRRRFARPHR